jgi:iron complex transport system permease protein
VLPRNRQIPRLLALSAILLLAFFIAPLIGAYPLLDKLFGPDFSDQAAYIFLYLRLPRVVMAALSGAALAAVGMVMQALLRNPLASPYTLGIASGSTTGVLLALLLGLGSGLSGVGLVFIFGVIAAALTSLLIYFFALRKSESSGQSLILIGVTIGLIFAAVNLLIQFFADFSQAAMMLRWLMGGLHAVAWQAILVIAGPVLLAVYLLWRRREALNILSLGSELALAKGIDITRLARELFIATAVIIGAIVSQTGPIGFVGLIIPHAMRLFVGPDHRYLLPASLLAGATVLILADAVARTILAPVEIPVGIITAIAGGPAFLAMMLGHWRQKAR